jgi:hypothetical protein
VFNALIPDNAEALDQVVMEKNLRNRELYSVLNIVIAVTCVFSRHMFPQSRTYLRFRANSTCPSKAATYAATWTRHPKLQDCISNIEVRASFPESTRHFPVWLHRYGFSWALSDTETATAKLAARVCNGFQIPVTIIVSMI